MRRKIFTLALAALTVGLLGSCSKINERIDDLDKRVSAIEASVGSINTSIEDLSTIRQNVQSLMSSPAVAPAEITKLKEADDTLGKRISALETLLEGEVSPYATIEELNKTAGDLAALDTKVAGIDDKLTQHIKDATDNIKTSIQNLQDKVGELVAMIQTVTIVPAYKDGSVEALDDTVTIDFLVSPASAVAAIEKENVSVLVNEVKTKAVNDTTAPVIGFSKNATKGTVSVKADLKELVPTEAKKSLTVAVKIASGVSNYTTEFVPVALTYTIHDVLPGVFSVSATQKVKFLRGNLWYKESDNSWHIEDKQYYTENDGFGERTTIDNRPFWNYYDREHLIAFYYPSSVQNSNYGTKDLRLIPEGTSDEVLHSVYGFTESDDYPLVDKIEWGEAYGKGHTLSYDEWGYLCSVEAALNEVSSVDCSNDVRVGRNKKHVSVAGCKGLLLVPDDWDLATNPLVETYTEEQWAAAEAAGAVFLPYVYGMEEDGLGLIDCASMQLLGFFLCGNSFLHNSDSRYAIYSNLPFNQGNPSLDIFGLTSFYAGLLGPVRLTVYVGE